MRPPEGSRITIDHGDLGNVINIPFDPPITAYLLGTFGALWLVGWAAGAVSAIRSLNAGGPDLFLLFWLTFWIIAGLTQVVWVIRTFMPVRPESIRLGLDRIHHDRGNGPPAFNELRHLSYLPRALDLNTRREIETRHLNTLRLRESAAGVRLTVDVRGHRVDLGERATEVEREWLYKLLTRHYRLRGHRSRTSAEVAS